MQMTFSRTSHSHNSHSFIYAAHRWRKGTDNLTPDDDIPTGKNVLTLKNMRETGVYTCIASSRLGLKEVNTTVKVQCKFLLKRRNLYGHR